MGRGGDNLLYGNTPVLRKEENQEIWERIALPGQGLLFSRSDGKTTILGANGATWSLGSEELSIATLSHRQDLAVCRGTTAAWHEKTYGIDDANYPTIGISRGQERFAVEASVLETGQKTEDVDLQVLNDRLLLYDRAGGKLYSYLLPSNASPDPTEVILPSDGWAQREARVVNFAPGNEGALWAEEHERGLRTTYIDAWGQQYSFFHWGNKKIAEDLASFISTPGEKPGVLYLVEGTGLVHLDCEKLESSLFARLPDRPLKMISRGSTVALLYQDGFSLFRNKNPLHEEKTEAVKDIAFQGDDLLLLTENGRRVLRHPGLLSINE